MNTWRARRCVNGGCQVATQVVPECHEGRCELEARASAPAPMPCDHVWKVTSQRLQGMWCKCEKCGATKEETWD